MRKFKKIASKYEVGLTWDLASEITAARVTRASAKFVQLYVTPGKSVSEIRRATKLEIQELKRHDILVTKLQSGLQQRAAAAVKGSAV